MRPSPYAQRTAFGFATLVALCPAPVLAASPWVSGQLHGYAQLGFTYFADYDAVAGPGGTDVALPRTLTNYTVSGYTQVGIAPHTDLQLTVPVKLLATGAPVGGEPTLASGTLNNLGDISIGAKHQWVESGGWALATQLDVSLPTGDSDVLTGLRTGYGTFGLSPAVAVGRGWQDAYVMAYAMATFRTPMAQTYDTLLGAGVEGGYHLWSRLWLAGVVEGVTSMEDGSYVNRIGLNEAGVFLDGESYFVAGGKLAVDITKAVGANVGAYKTITSVYTPKAFGVNVGVSAKW